MENRIKVRRISSLLVFFRFNCIVVSHFGLQCDTFNRPKPFSYINWLKTPFSQPDRFIRELSFGNIFSNFNTISDFSFAMNSHVIEIRIIFTQMKNPLMRVTVPKLFKQMKMTMKMKIRMKLTLTYTITMMMIMKIRADFMKLVCNQTTTTSTNDHSYCCSCLAVVVIVVIVIIVIIVVVTVVVIVIANSLDVRESLYPRKRTFEATHEILIP